MARTRRSRLFLAGCLASFVAPRTAQAVPRGLELVWSAPEGCPTEPEVLAAIEQLVGGPDAALERPLQADARVERHGDGFRLALSWRTATASAVRTVDGATCAEVAQAAAVIVALAADPTTNLEEQASTALDEPTAPPPLAPPPSEPAPQPTRAPSTPPPPETATPHRASSQDADTRPGVRAGASLELGSLPRAAPGLFLGGELPLPPISLVLEALTFLPTDEVVAEGAGTFWLSALSLRPCYPIAISRVAVAPCAALELHAMLGEGDRVDFPSERWAFYPRFGAGFEAAYRLSSRLDLLAGGFLLAAPTRPTFVIGNGTPVHEPATIAGRLTLGFELRL